MTLPPSTDKDLWVSWDVYHGLIEHLALQIHQSGWQFDHLVCLARGGLRVGDVLSRIFDKPLAILMASSYRDHSGTTRSQLNIARSATMMAEQLEGRVLVVDDMVDSGVTLERVTQHLRGRYHGVTELKTGVLWFKAQSCIKPDFYVQELVTNPWIHQPFERYDSLRPAALAELLGE